MLEKQIFNHCMLPSVTCESVYSESEYDNTKNLPQRKRLLTKFASNNKIIYENMCEHGRCEKFGRLKVIRR